jgi:hypothetical protein
MEATRRTHELKTWPAFYDGIITLQKNFECRFNDRGFAVGDLLILKEYDPLIGVYTGRWCARRVTYIVDACRFEGLKEGFCIMGLSVAIDTLEGDNDPDGDHACEDLKGPVCEGRR